MKIIKYLHEEDGWVSTLNPFLSLCQISRDINSVFSLCACFSRINMKKIIYQVFFYLNLSEGKLYRYTKEYRGTVISANKSITNICLFTDANWMLIAMVLFWLSVKIQHERRHEYEGQNQTFLAFKNIFLIKIGKTNKNSIHLEYRIRWL